jgi:hypothetical protein
VHELRETHGKALLHAACQAAGEKSPERPAVPVGVERESGASTSVSVVSKSVSTSESGKRLRNKGLTRPFHFFAFPGNRVAPRVVFTFSFKTLRKKLEILETSSSAGC